MRHEPGTLLCLACYQDRLASVCENADEYKLFEIREDNIYPAGRLSLPSKGPYGQDIRHIGLRGNLLLCGAIGVDTRMRLEGGGVGVIPWLTGGIDEVVAAYQGGALAGLTMPGCRQYAPEDGRPPQAHRERE